MSHNNSATPGWQQSCRHSYALEYHIDIPGIYNRRVSYNEILDLAQGPSDLPVLIPSSSQIGISLINNKFCIGILHALIEDNTHHKTRVPCAKADDAKWPPGADGLFNNGIPGVEAMLISAGGGLTANAILETGLHDRSHRLYSCCGW